jgi:hypothetical protein
LVSSLLLPGLDYRLGWSRQYLGPVPLWLTLLSLAFVLGSYLFMIWVRVEDQSPIPRRQLSFRATR